MTLENLETHLAMTLLVAPCKNEGIKGLKTFSGTFSGMGDSLAITNTTLGVALLEYRCHAVRLQFLIYPQKNTFFHLIQ